MTNKRWRKHTAIILAMSLFAMNFSAVGAESQKTPTEKEQTVSETASEDKEEKNKEEKEEPKAQEAEVKEEKEEPKAQEAEVKEEKEEPKAQEAEVKEEKEEPKAQEAEKEVPAAEEPSEPAPAAEEPEAPAPAAEEPAAPAPAVEEPAAPAPAAEEPAAPAPAAEEPAAPAPAAEEPAAPAPAAEEPAAPAPAAEEPAAPAPAAEEPAAPAPAAEEPAAPAPAAEEPAAPAPAAEESSEPAQAAEENAAPAAEAEEIAQSTEETGLGGEVALDENTVANLAEDEQPAGDLQGADNAAPTETAAAGGNAAADTASTPDQTQNGTAAAPGAGTAAAEDGASNGNSTADTAADAQTGVTEVTTASASVSWKDDNDANDIRPGFMTIYLQVSEDGVNFDTGIPYELNAENNWQIKLESLPTQRDGKPVYYRWVWDVHQVPGATEEELDEYSVVGYTRTKNDNSDDHLQTSREYTHVTVKEKYTIVIDWDDNGDDTAKRPKSLDVTLPDGRVITLTEKNGWKADVELPVVQRDLVWQLGAADGWVAAGNSTDYSDENVTVTFNRKWKTVKKKEKITTETEVEEEAGTSTLTIQYWIGNEIAVPSFTGVYENGQKYNVSVPKLTGYRASVSKVKGTIGEDTIVNVRYIPNTYTVTVYYRYLNGETAAETATQEVKTGSSYDIFSPQLNGYMASSQNVSGTVTGRDLTYVVYYTGIIPDNNNGAGRQDAQVITVAGGTNAAPETAEATEIDEYATPLGLGEVGINAGECFE